MSRATDGVIVEWSWTGGCPPVRGNVTVTSADSQYATTYDASSSSGAVFDRPPLPSCQNRRRLTYTLVLEDDAGHPAQESVTIELTGGDCRPTATPTAASEATRTPTVSATPSRPVPTSTTAAVSPAWPVVTNEPTPKLAPAGNSPTEPPDPLGAAAAAALAVVAMGGVLGGRNGREETGGPGARPGGGSNGQARSGRGRAATSPRPKRSPEAIGDRPDLPGELAPIASLNGFWVQDELPGRFIVYQEGTTVRALRGEPWVCLPDGPVPSDESDAGENPQSSLHFQVSSDGSSLVGAMGVCWFGDDDPRWAPASVELSMSEDEGRLSGKWRDEVRGVEVPLTLSRLHHSRLTAQDFGLPAANERVFGYQVRRAYRKNGSIVAVTEEYARDPRIDDDVLRHMGVDFLSRDQAWRVAKLDFATPVGGVVQIYAGSPWNTVVVLLDTGDQLQFLHASEVYVGTGDRVEPGTVIGRTGKAGTHTIHLHVQAKNASGEYISPDWAVARARAERPVPDGEARGV
ncbi:MAG: peptidoglycan DD-metalloendopeptidase family protein [Chloroflexi bacterium]|nr:peptidoglycan DD-metalloendopeptidase family protein [Chloroflexota bacterium]